MHRAASKFQNKIPPDKCDGLLMWVFPREKFRRAPKLELNAALEIGQQHGDFWRLYHLGDADLSGVTAAIHRHKQLFEIKA